MQTIGQQQLWSLLENKQKAEAATCTQVRKDAGHRVSDYLDLATKIAELQFRNREYVLLFRGQSKDYKNREHNTSLKPTIFRASGGEKLSPDELTSRFDKLELAGQLLFERYAETELLGKETLGRHRIMRWSILQHYEVCATPLLDVTHSLRIAASFASDGSKGDAYIFVLGVPNLSGAITASAEANLQIVRLSSVCPPSAVRPHIQEGYLLGEYPELSAYQQKRLYGDYEIDFGLRLVAKFRFDPRTFWKRDQFPQVHHKALYPAPSNDPLCALTQDVRALLD